MARMSIDDMISRDTRVDRLAKMCGWSRRETRACLEDIWALCYDRVTPYLPADDIEVTALRDAISPPAHAAGFVDAVLAVGLARSAVASDRFFVSKDGSKIPWKDVEWRGRLYIAGASERVGYLLVKREAGHRGGRKSGESRKNKPKQCFDFASSETQARGNPSASASASASVPDHKDPATPIGAPAGGLAEVKEKTQRHAADRAAKIPDRAWKAADYLRERVIADDPNALVSREPWGDDVRSGWRLKWADEIRLMVTRDGRTYEQIAEVLRYVFAEQTGDAKFVVESADALRRKFDRIQAVRRNKQPDKAQQRFATIPIASSSRGNV